MNLRLRLFVIVLGAGLVALTYTYPLWSPLLQETGEVVLFPELPEELRPAFDALPVARQQDYLALRAADATLALRMVSAALQPDVIVPDEEQQQPNREGQTAVRRGTFTTITPNRSAQGSMTLYEMPDGSRYLWLSDFSVINGPALRLFVSPLNAAALLALTRDNDPTNDEYQLTLEDVRLDPLRANVGNQAYEVPREINLDRYNSILIYSTDLNLLYSYAQF